MRTVIALVLASSVVPASARTYDDIFSEQAKQVYDEDINVWVYTAEFAKRFGMPERWIDEGLKGAEAVAFRLETSSGRLMFPHKGKSTSMANARCLLDVYVDSKAPIPWVDDRSSAFRPFTPNSRRYLVPQQMSDRRWLNRQLGLPDHGKTVRFGTTKENLGGLTVREYDREAYPGLAYISFGFGCSNPPKSDSWIELWNYRKEPIKQPAMFDYSAKATTLAHRIDIPGSYMVRLYAHWYERYGKGAGEQRQQVIEGKAADEGNDALKD